MFKNLGDMAKLMGEARKMQEKLAEARGRIDEMEVEGESGAGMVRVVVTGAGVLKRLEIDPALLTPEDRDAVQDLVVAAVASAQENARLRAEQEMAKLTEGLPIPPGMTPPGM